MLDSKILQELTDIVGTQYVLTSPEDLITYSYDGTPVLDSKPDVVVRPATTEQVSAIMKLAYRHSIPLVPRGSGTGLSGGSVPVKGGIVLMTGRMNKILEIDPENLSATVQSGVITAEFQAEVEKTGLFYPPDPSSNAISTMGGNVAENSGGLRGLKYGVTQDYIMGLEIVMSNGDILWTGGKSVKDVAGYGLKKLFVGSEGTLGIFTKIMVKLIPLPEAKKTLLALYENVVDAARTVSAIISAKVIPSTLEIMDDVTIRCVEDYAHIGLPTEVGALLLIEVDGRKSEVEEDAQKVQALCKDHNASNVSVAKDQDEAANLMKARRTALAALSRMRPTTILEDATVPRNRVADMVSEIRRIADKYNVMMGIFGHAGDGNLHPTAMADERNKEEMERVEKAFEEIFEAAVSFGGTITGEHGIGVAKSRFLPKAIGDIGIATMKQIKNALDPKDVLNPGKMFVETTVNK